LKFAGFERPDREGLKPGQPCAGKPGTELYEANHEQRSRRWRVRAVNPHTVGKAERVSLKVSIDWRRFNEYPRYPEAASPGMRRKYAARQALMYRLRNQMEGYWSRVKTSLKMAGKDASRVRFQDISIYETVLRLGELRFNALSLAQERHNTHQPLPELPDAPIGPLPVQGQGGYKAVIGHQRRAGDSWATGYEPLRLRGGQQRHAVAENPVPSAMPPAAKAARDGALGLTVTAQPAEEKAATEPLDVPGVMERLDELDAAKHAIAASVANKEELVMPDNVISIDFGRRRRHG
jgi:hypothetical protein